MKTLIFVSLLSLTSACSLFGPPSGLLPSGPDSGGDSNSPPPRYSVLDEYVRQALDRYNEKRTEQDGGA